MIFLELVKTLSFSETAIRLDYTQSAVSKRLRSIEEFYHVQLFERTSHEVKLTAAGEALFEYAQRIVNLLRESQDVVNARGAVQRIQLGASTMISHWVVENFLSKWKELQPTVCVNLVTSDSDTLLMALARAELDIAVTGIAANRSFGLESFPMFEDEVLFVSLSGHHKDRSGGDSVFQSEYVVTLQELWSRPLVVPQKGDAVRLLAERCLRAKGYQLDKHPFLQEMGTQDTVIQWLESIGQGDKTVGLVSRIAAQRSLQEGRLVPLSVEGITLKRSFFISWRPSLSPQTIGILRHILAQLRLTYDQ